MKKLLLCCALLASYVVCLSIVALGQERPTGSIGVWLNDRIKAVTQQDIAARITQRDSARQGEAPAISANTTSLIDRSSAADFVSTALNIAGLTSNSSSMKSTSMSATVSAYALKAAAAKHDPLDPAFYNANRDWRRLSVTLGYDYPEDKVGDINERAIVFGVKYLPYDKRDATDSGNAVAIKTVSDLAVDAGVAASRLAGAVQEFVRSALKRDGHPNADGPESISLYFDAGAWGKTYVEFLSENDRQMIDELIRRQIGPFVRLTQESSRLTDEIHSKPQIALAYFLKQRRANRPDEHSVEAIFDLSIKPRFTFTLNANFQYVDNKMAPDNKGGKVAAELQLQLNRDKLEGRMPIFLSFSGNGSWMTNTIPVYEAQAKLSIPLLPGVEMPLSVSYASRTDLIKEQDIRGKFGFTFDVTRIAQALSSGLFGKR
jgi:hypothetical protein